MREQDVEHVRAAADQPPENDLGALVVQPRPEKIVAGIEVDAPAGEGARRLLDVLLAVLAFAQGEELHQLAREVLVRLAAAIGRRVEVDDHRRILRYRVQQRAEVAERVPAQ
jgi:hypothetical protein